LVLSTKRFIFSATHAPEGNPLIWGIFAVVVMALLSVVGDILRSQPDAADGMT
jgi:hypothetical protein